MCGYGNALTFQDVDDSDITAVQDFIRNKALGFLANKIDESFPDDARESDLLIEDDLLEEYFGPLFKQKTDEFEFRSGDIKLIKQIKKYVKNKIDKNGMKVFVPKPRRPKRKVTNVSQNPTPPDIFDSDTMLTTLKTSLFTKIMASYQMYNVNELVDLQNVDPDTVSVSIETGQIFGHVYCVLCQNDITKKNQKPIRISHHSEDRSEYWIPSNFITHLRRKHKLVKTSTGNSTPTDILNDIETLDPIANASKAEKFVKNELVADDLFTAPMLNAIKTENISEDGIPPAEVAVTLKAEVVDENESVFITNEEALSEINISADQLYQQFSSQITTMTHALYSRAKQDEMKIKLYGSDFRTVKVLVTPRDGNCLFTSLAHQLFGLKISSKEMKAARNELRANVVKYIQSNYELFEHEIKGRVLDNFEDKDPNCDDWDVSIDVEKEKIFFINQLLPQDKYWGGSETLKAVSDLHEVNIIIFNEGDICHIMNSFGKSYGKTIGVAFRLVQQESVQRNHYDSVVDMASNDIIALAEYLTTNNKNEHYRRAT